MKMVGSQYNKHGLIWIVQQVTTHIAGRPEPLKLLRVARWLRLDAQA